MPPAFQKPTIGQPSWGAAANAAFDNLNGRLTRVAYDVKEYGAVGDGVADDSVAILAAISAAQPVKGTVYFPPGIYRTSQTVPIYSDMDYVGAGVGATTIKLANSANVDLFKTDQYDSLIGGSTQGGPFRWSIRNMTMDGNGANQSAGRIGSIYGKNYHIDNVQFLNGKTGGIKSKWGGGGDNMEAQWSNFKIGNCIAGVSLDWEGPNDSVFTNAQIWMDSSITPAAGNRGVRLSGNAGGEMFTNVHVWGAFEVGWYLDIGSDGCLFYNCESEGCGTNVYLNSSSNMFHGKIFGSNGGNIYAVANGGPGEIGVKFGTSAVTAVNSNVVKAFMFNWVSGDKPLLFDNDAGNDVETVNRTGSATATVFGTPSFKSNLRVIDPTTPQFSQSSQGLGGNGAPNASLGVVGSFYHRWDGVAGTRLYHKTAVGTWTAITSANL